MRRLGVVLLLLVCALALAGCAGADARRAQALLERAVQAQGQLKSATFLAEMSIDVPGVDYSATLEGGGYFKGRRRGDLYFRVDAAAGAIGSTSAGILARRGHVFLLEDTSWREVPTKGRTPEALGAPSSEEIANGIGKIVGAVEDVAVSEGRVFEGEPATFVIGRLDGPRFLRSISDLPGPSLGTEIDDEIGDLNVTLMFSDRSGLLRGAVISLEAGGGTLRIVYRLTGMNKRVKLPRIAA